MIGGCVDGGSIHCSRSIGRVIPFGAVAVTRRRIILSAVLLFGKRRVRRGQRRFLRVVRFIVGLLVSTFWYVVSFAIVEVRGILFFKQWIATGINLKIFT